VQREGGALRSHRSSLRGEGGRRRDSPPGRGRTSFERSPRASRPTRATTTVSQSTKLKVFAVFLSLALPPFSRRCIERGRRQMGETCCPQIDVRIGVGGKASLSLGEKAPLHGDLCAVAKDGAKACAVNAPRKPSLQRHPPKWALLPLHFPVRDPLRRQKRLSKGAFRSTTTTTWRTRRLGWPTQATSAG